MAQDALVNSPPTARGTTMFDQAAILSDIIRREQALAVSPARLERRRIANMLEALRCCAGAAFATRSLARFGGSDAACGNTA
jgi:hypothetical protein